MVEDIGRGARKGASLGPGSVHQVGLYHHEDGQVHRLLDALNMDVHPVRSLD